MIPSPKKKELIEKAAEFVRNKEKSKSELIEELTQLTTRMERLEGTVEAAVLDRSNGKESGSKKVGADREVEKEVERRVAERLESEVEQQVKERTEELERLMRERTELEIERQLSERLKHMSDPEETPSSSSVDDPDEELELRVAERTRELEASVDELSAEVELKSLTQEELRRAEEEKQSLQDQLAELQQQFDETLSQKIQSFQGAASKVPVLLWLWQADEGFVATNGSWLEFRGRRSDEEQGEGWRAGLHPEESERWQEEFEEAVQAERPFQHVHRLQRADGTFRWLLSEAVPYRPDKDTLCYLGSSVDVNEFKSREDERQEELEEVRRELQERDQQMESHREEISHLQETVRRLAADAEERAASMTNGMRGEMEAFLGGSAQRLENVLGEVREIEEQVRGLSGRMGDLFGSLGPVVGEDEELPQALGRLADSLHEEFGWDCTVEEKGLEPIDASARRALFLPLRELLRSLARSREVTSPFTLAGGRVDGNVHLQVEGDLQPADIGGLDDNNGSPDALRLFAARQVLEGHGGWIEIEAEEDGGPVRLQFVLPLEPEAA